MTRAAAIAALPFKLGDIVSLQSDDQLMTVTCVSCSLVNCSWFSEGKLQEEEFHYDCVRKRELHETQIPF